MLSRYGTRLVLLVALATNVACYKAGQKAPTLQTRTGNEGQPAVSPPELVSLTETLADTYAITIAQAVNRIQENSDPLVRKQAQQVKAFVGATAYSLAASPNPEIAMIDLVVNISIQRSLFSKGIATQMFGERASHLVDAYATVEGAGWSTLKRVYTDQQLALIRDGIARWLSANPHSGSLPFVRVPALAKYRDLSSVSSAGSIRLMAPVAEASKTAMELRLLGERSLFVAQRYPFLLNWYGEQALYDAMAPPEPQEGIKGAASFAPAANCLAAPR